MNRDGRAVALALLAWPGMVSESPASQARSWRHVLMCATFRPLLKGPLQSRFTSLLFSCMIKIIYNSQRLFSPSHLFLLQQVVANRSAPEEGTQLLLEAIGAVPVFPREVVSTHCLGMHLNIFLTAPCAQIQQVLYWEYEVFKASAEAPLDQYCFPKRVLPCRVKYKCIC